MGRTMLKDEQGKMSSGRALLWAWSLASLYLVVTQYASIDNNILAFLSTIELALIGWVGGARVAEYIFPALKDTVKTIVTAKTRFPVRDHDMGIQPTQEADDHV